MSKVYIRTDGENRIVQCEGGFSIENIHDFSEWIEIDEGEGPRYDHCQSLYFDALYTEDGVPRYAYENGAVRLRTAAEIDADRPAPDPAQDLSLRERINDLEIAICELMDAMA